jgi:hypothetical protein
LVGGNEPKDCTAFVESNLGGNALHFVFITFAVHTANPSILFVIFLDHDLTANDVPAGHIPRGKIRESSSSYRVPPL